MSTVTTVVNSDTIKALDEQYREFGDPEVLSKYKVIVKKYGLTRTAVGKFLAAQNPNWRKDLGTSPELAAKVTFAWLANYKKENSPWDYWWAIDAMIEEREDQLHEKRTNKLDREVKKASKALDAARRACEYAAENAASANRVLARAEEEVAVRHSEYDEAESEIIRHMESR